MPAVTQVGGIDHLEAAATSATIQATKVGITPNGNVVVAVASLSFACTQVSDGTTTKSTPDVSINQASMSMFLALFSFPNHPGGTKTFTATFANAATADRAIAILELTPSQLDAIVSVSNGFDAASTISAGTLSPAVNGEYIVGFVVDANPVTTGSGFTDLLNDTTVNDSDFEGLAQGTAAPIAVTWSHTALGTWGAIAASYKPAGSGVPPMFRGV